MYNRSSDLVLGLPFNIVWQSLLMHFICRKVGLKTGKINITIGNAHIYNEHIDLFLSENYYEKIRQ